jgi:hypothetical protein
LLYGGGGITTDANVIHEELIEIIRDADQILSRVKFKKHIKPFWNKNLKI